MADFGTLPFSSSLRLRLTKPALLNAVSACGVSSNNSGRSEFMTEGSLQAMMPARPRHGGYLCADINQRTGRIAVIARRCCAIERCQSQHFDAALDTLFHLMRQQ